MLRRIRIPVQLASLLVFLYLLIRTVGIGEDRLGPPVRIFLEIDPLIAISTWLRTGAVPGWMILSGITLLLTLFLGRFFCSWICPLGTLSQASLRLLRRRREERTADRWRRSQRWKFLLLVFVLGAALAGSAWTGLVDPISITIRSLALGFGPGLEWALRGAAASLAFTPAGDVTDPIYFWIRDRAMAPQPPRFEQGMLFAFIFLGILGLSFARRRFWCRVLCPLGALLGVTAQAGALKLHQKSETCSQCELCTFHCQGAADPDVMGGWRATECFVCGNCTASCSRSGLTFGVVPPRFAGWFLGVVQNTKRWVRVRVAGVRRSVASRTGAGRGRSRPGDHDDAWSPQRRWLLVGLGLGLVSGPLGRVTPALAHPKGRTIRPPGAGTEEEFLDRCVRCGECMKVCVGNGLHPDGLGSGLLSLWTPVLRARLGYCEYHCTLCGQVCPTGAIERLTQEEKIRTVIGIAWVDTDRCLPFAYNRPCIVCEEHCPTSPKAIVLDEVMGTRPDGSPVELRRPRVILERCVGCGICEFRCPVEGEAAIVVTTSGRVESYAPIL